MLHKFNQLFLFQKKERRKKNYLSLLRLEMQTQISLFFFILVSFSIFNRNISDYGEIIESSGEPRHLSIIPLKKFYLFKIAELVINFCLKFFSN